MRRVRLAEQVPPRPSKGALLAADAPHAPSFSVVAIGASAGGLDACRTFLSALPRAPGIAFILVQHLDPNHESMMVDLLSGDTTMTVQQAAEGTVIQSDHLYIIPPGTYLSVVGGHLHLSQPLARHGARLPFDFLLHSLAEEYGARAICIVLSGTGADGSLGLKSIKEKCGLVIAQDPAEATYEGMPRNAILTGSVDVVLPVAQIPPMLETYNQRLDGLRAQRKRSTQSGSRDWLPDIIDLLRTKTAHNFTLYKPGTLQRRVERRMALATIESHDMEHYLELLRSDPNELDLLAKDLLINVTSFFRDSKVFELLERKIIPDLVRNQPADTPLRIWIAGCSTGEETYSLAMLFREAIMAEKSNVKIQIFASDVDPDAVARAREGFYPETIEAEVSPARLARFFSKDDQKYRVIPVLREMVVFTVQDLLADPPFSRLDLVSCRNLLIYLQPEAQTKVLSLLHFALRQGGLLLLGSSETTGISNQRFDLISESERLYRRVGNSRQGEFGFARKATGDIHIAARAPPGPLLTRQAALVELCQRLVTESLAPAAVLINRRYECLHYLGPTDLYLKVPEGRPIHDLLAMARDGVRTKLRSAIQRASQENKRVAITGGQVSRGDAVCAFSVTAQPVQFDGEQLLLVCFMDEPVRERRERSPAGQVPRVAELERELEVTRTELEGAIHNLEISSQEQKAINEEALSVNEEYQSTNEELLTSKEELQSLNEELTALNTQLQETLERQRTTSNDLQNILYSTDVATLFLDTDLNIRFFTPATESLFHIIPGDVGRPLADLSSLAADSSLLSDARTVLQTFAPLEREIESQNSAWYIRRILPYRTPDHEIEGVVITFADITERKRVADVLAAAKREAQLANVAKSRFVAAASHDLRQPLQTLVLLHEQLAKTFEGVVAQKLLKLLDETLGAMSGMLNTLLDINQIEAGTVQVEKTAFPVGLLLERLGAEHALQAQAQGLVLHVVPCDLTILSDARLLEQMIRNLLSNALKYTRRGKVLLGCRRHDGILTIQVWDTGIGIPAGELQNIFDEYHQLDNPARDRSRGLGLGLSLVQRLAVLLGHQTGVRSHRGEGSVFSIDVPIADGLLMAGDRERPLEDVMFEPISRTGAILVIEDDPHLRELLAHLLTREGHHTVVAPDGVAALELVTKGTISPDLILADYNLPNGIDGIQLAKRLREKLQRNIPAIVLTGDIAIETLRSIVAEGCVQLSKPMRPEELMRAIQRLLPMSQSARAARPPSYESSRDTAMPVVFVVDDNSHLREAMRTVLEDSGRIVETYASCEAFLESYRPGGEACLVIDAYLPGMKGLELLKRLKDEGHHLPAIMITGNSDVKMAVEAMKAGVSDFIEKPIGHAELQASIDRAFEQARDSSKVFGWSQNRSYSIANLTTREQEILEMVLAGQPSKNIAADLNISQRTVENHRAAIMKKTGSKSLPALARFAMAAAWTPADKAAAQPMQSMLLDKSKP
jgi:two-component system CheB/CheR fusion protein